MLPIEILQFWIAIFTVIMSCFFLWAVRFLPPNRIKNLFLIFLVPYFVWGESLLWMQVLGAEHGFSRLVSQMIHLCGGLFHAALGVFFLQFCCSRRIKERRCIFLIGGVAIVSVLSLFGVIEDGVVYTPESGLFPRPGPLLPLFNIALLSWGIYYFRAVRRAYVALEAMSFVRAQLRFVALPAVSAIGTTLVTNVIVPGLGGTYSLTPLAAFWIFLFLVSVGYTVIQGRTLLIRECASEFDVLAMSDRPPMLEETADKFLRFVAPVLRSELHSSRDVLRSGLKSLAAPTTGAETTFLNV